MNKLAASIRSCEVGALALTFTLVVMCLVEAHTTADFMWVFCPAVVGWMLRVTNEELAGLVLLLAVIGVLVWAVGADPASGAICCVYFGYMVAREIENIHRIGGAEDA